MFFASLKSLSFSFPLSIGEILWSFCKSVKFICHFICVPKPGLLIPLNNDLAGTHATLRPAFLNGPCSVFIEYKYAGSSQRKFVQQCPPCRTICGFRVKFTVWISIVVIVLFAKWFPTEWMRNVNWLLINVYFLYIFFMFLQKCIVFLALNKCLRYFKGVLITRTKRDRIMTVFDGVSVSRFSNAHLLPLT